MPDLDIDSDQPLTIDATLDTPLRISVEFLYRVSGEKMWRSFFTAHVGAEISNQVFSTILKPLPKGSALLLTMVFSGAKKTAYRGSIKFSQIGTKIGDSLAVTGSTKSKYASYKEIEVSLT